MLNLIDEKGKKYGAIAEVKETNGVNGERSLVGTIYTNDEVIDGIDRGWQILWKGEKYYIIFSMPVDLGETVEVQFDAVHQFFYDFSKSAVEEQLSDGSHTMQAYLDFIFKNSGYNFRLDAQVNAFEKQSFGYKNRLALFNDVIKSAGVEFTVNGNVVRIINRVGNDLSTIVKKGFNLNELKIEKNIGDFITHMAGFGKWYDEENHDKGRLTASYTSPLAEIYGKRDGDPVVDERYTNKENLTARLKEEVENSYNISVTIDMEDLTRAGYEYKQPRAGDSIMAINEDLNFSRKIRIISYTSYYDTNDELIKHEVSCNSVSMAQASTSNQLGLQKQLDQIKEQLSLTNQTANHAMVSADGKNNIFYGDEKPDPNQVKLTIGDLWFDTSGEDTVMNIWNGVEWRRASFDKTAFDRQFAEIEELLEKYSQDLKDLTIRNEEELAEFEKQIEELRKYGVSEEQIDEAIKRAGFDTVEIEEIQRRLDESDRRTKIGSVEIENIRRQLGETSDTAELAVEMIGNDGETRYGRNRVGGETDGQIEFGGQPLEVTHNGDGFVAGQTYTISFDALCEMLAKVGYTIDFNYPSEVAREVTVKLTPDAEVLDTIERTVTDSFEDELFAEQSYTVVISSDFYKTVTFRVQTAEDLIERLDLAFKEIIAGDLTSDRILNWNDNPELVIKGVM